MRSTNALASSTIASASTVNVAAADGESVQITGTTTITSLGTGFNGCYRELRFAAGCQLTHSTSLKLPGNADITTASGDILGFRCTGSGVWELVNGNVWATAAEIANKASTDAANTFTSGGQVFLHNGTQGSVPAIYRDGAAVNSSVEFKTTGGSIFIGYGSAGTFAIGDNSSLSTSFGRWLQVTSSGLGDETLIGGEPVGFRNIPSAVQNGNYTFVLADSGRCKIKGDSASYAYTVPPESSVAYPLGTVLAAVNRGGAGTITLAQGAGVSLFLAGDTSVAAGNRTVGLRGVATLVKVSTDTWFVSGPGVS